MIGDDFAQVLAGAQRGDHPAIEVIYLDVAPLVLGYLRANGAFEPEDIASEVFISMMRGLPSFQGDETNFRSWLLTIAHRRLTDAIRKHGRRPEEPAPLDELGNRMVVLRDSESEAMARLRSQGVLEAIDQLTPDQRSVLMLRVLADLTVPEIAGIVGKPESAVKALLRRGLASLGRLVGEAEGQEGGSAGRRE
ncbi:MAG: RNA polymerase sigma factor [Actinobacteria bacterium]|nr:RNA polymerase sigma factor [Actinomycetota bacterium]